MAAPQDLDADQFELAVKEVPGAVLVDFWSQTCPHCLHFGPSFAEASETGRPGVRFAKVAYQEAGPLFAQYRVSAVPTMVLFRDGQEVARQSGAQSAAQVLAWLEAQLA